MDVPQRNKQRDKARPKAESVNGEESTQSFEQHDLSMGCPFCEVVHAVFHRIHRSLGWFFPVETSFGVVCHLNTLLLVHVRLCIRHQVSLGQGHRPSDALQLQTRAERCVRPQSPPPPHVCTTFATRTLASSYARPMENKVPNVSPTNATCWCPFIRNTMDAQAAMIVSMPQKVAAPTNLTTTRVFQRLASIRISLRQTTPQKQCEAGWLRPTALAGDELWGEVQQVRRHVHAGGRIGCTKGLANQGLARHGINGVPTLLDIFKSL